MRLIEKKCPNCGADLEFDENAKSCKCTYCKRSFEIERDLNDVEKFNLIYDKIQKPMGKIMLAPMIFAGVFFVIIAGVIVYNVFSFHKTDTNKEPKVPSINDLIDGDAKLVTDAAELTNEDLDDLDDRSYSIVHQSVTGRSDTTYSYQITGDPKVEKVVVAYKDEANKVIPIYKVLYHNFFNQSDVQTVYVPVVFENIKSEALFSFASGKNPAPEYYLNDDHSTYIYAYGSYDEAYNNVVKPLEDEGFTITEK